VRPLIHAHITAKFADLNCLFR